MQLRATLDHRAGHLPDRAEPDDQRLSCAGDDATQQVSARQVGAERVRPAGRLQRRVQVDGERVVGCEQVGCHRRHEQ